MLLWFTSKPGMDCMIDMRVRFVDSTFLGPWVQA